MACPGAVSPTKVYSGCPSKVAWVEPSDRLMVPKVPVTPDAVADPFTGGQFCAHVPLQLDVVVVSGANEYSVNPLALVSTVAPPIVAVFRLPAVAAAGLLICCCRRWWRMCLTNCTPPVPPWLRLPLAVPAASADGSVLPAG